MDNKKQVMVFEGSRGLSCQVLGGGGGGGGSPADGQQSPVSGAGKRRLAESGALAKQRRGKAPANRNQLGSDSSGDASGDASGEPTGQLEDQCEPGALQEAPGDEQQEQAPREAGAESDACQPEERSEARKDEPRQAGEKRRSAAGAREQRGVQPEPADRQQLQQVQVQLRRQAENVCASCHKPIKERYLLMALEKRWHEDCLKCACCECRLAEVGSSLFIHSDKIFCRRDFVRIFGPAGSCAVCREPIAPHEMVMRASQHAYHLECFRCLGCQRTFCVGDPHYLAESGRILCVDCHRPATPPPIKIAYKGPAAVRQPGEPAAAAASATTAVD